MNACGIAGTVFDWWTTKPLFLTAVGVGGNRGRGVEDIDHCQSVGSGNASLTPAYGGCCERNTGSHRQTGRMQTKILTGYPGLVTVFSFFCFSDFQ